MAYKIALDVKCRKSSCNRQATFKVRNKWNDEIGKFCPKHADEMVAIQNSFESEAAK